MKTYVNRDKYDQPSIYDDIFEMTVHVQFHEFGKMYKRFLAVRIVNHVQMFVVCTHICSNGTCHPQEQYRLSNLNISINTSFTHT